MRGPTELKRTTPKLFKSFLPMTKASSPSGGKGCRRPRCSHKLLQHGSLGDAPARAQGGGDAQPRSTKEPCVYFLKGKCSRGTRCRFRHLQTFVRNGDRRIFSKKSTKRQQGDFQTSSRKPGYRRPSNRQPLLCFSCGKPGHLKRECRSRRRDSANMGLDFVMPAVEADIPATPMRQSMVSDMVNMAAGQQANLTSKWLIDGGASCHVVGCGCQGLVLLEQCDNF